MRNKGILLVIFIFILFVVAILFTPTPTDWNYNYSKDSKDPYGSYMLFEELNEIFPNAEIIVSDTIVQATLEDWDKSNTAFISVGTNISIISFADFLKNDSLKNNHVFFTSNHLYYKGDEMSLDTSVISRIETKDVDDSINFGIFGGNNINSQETCLSILQNERVDTTTYEYANQHFLVDSLSYIQLGTINDTVPNFINIPYGENSLFLHSNSAVFTNYAMLNENLAGYASEVLSHMDNIEYVIWDENAKPGNSFFGRSNVERKSPLYLINQNRHLYIAKILLFLGCILLMFTYARRRQQAIPIINPPSNKSVEFVTNMGKLYHEKADHIDIARKKIKFFEFGIRRQFQLNEIISYKKKPEELAKLTGFQVDDIKNYFKLRDIATNNSQIDEQRLIQISNSIETLKKNQL